MKDLDKILILKDSNIIQCLEKLNVGATKFVLVVDKDRKLLGTVTDGDVRRGILNKVDLNSNVQDIMNTNPVVAHSDLSRNEIQKIMIERDISFIPLVDSENKIISVHLLKELLSFEKKENYVILMVGGLGTRLMELTAETPKPMLDVGGKPILLTIVEQLKKFGYHKFIFAINYKSHVIENFFGDGRKFDISVSYIKEERRMGTAGALSLIQIENNLPFIVMNGDVLTKMNFDELLKHHVLNDFDATICLRKYDYQIPFGVVSIEGDRVLHIEEKPVKSHYVSSGIYMLSPKVLKEIPHDSYFDMPALFEKMVNSDCKVGAFPFFEYWIDIGRIDDFHRAQSEFLNFFN